MLVQKKKRKKLNDREHNQTPHLLNQQFKFRGGGQKGRMDNKYDYASSGGVFSKKNLGKSPPAATQFGNFFDRNFTPMSRLAYSTSNRPTKKAKKPKYKSGHVRRETRLKKAFEEMKKTI
eukprot:111120_1